MPLRESLQSAIARFTSDRVPSPRLNAELLLMFTLNCDRAHLYAHPERELTKEEQSRYDEALTQRTKGVPAQYITGHQEFWGLDLIVSPAVLIPRPETEHLIETVLPLAGALKNPKIADVGTGSGAIALALAKELPNAEIHATDISPSALEIAEANAARLQLEFRTSSHHKLERSLFFHDTDLLNGLETAAFDFVVSNPYVGEAEEDQVQLEVRKFEPRTAVFAGPTRSHREPDPRSPHRTPARRLPYYGNQRHDRGPRARTPAWLGRHNTDKRLAGNSARRLSPQAAFLG
jgi:release factor glutamine methyltransferase